MSDPMSSGHAVPRLGIGISGPHGTFLLRPETTIAIIVRAYLRGVRYFDTAPSYGAGEAERRLGEALTRLPGSDAIISTKAGILSTGVMRRHRDFSPRAIRASLESSLKRLRRSRVDRLFLHGPASNELTDELFRTLEDLKSKGDVGALGVCGIGRELEDAMSTGQFSYFMTPIHPGLEPPAIARAARLRASGELIGIETMATLKKKSSPVNAGATFRLARKVMARARTVPYAPISYDEAIRWSLNEGGAHSIVTTTSRLDHLEANIEAVKAIRIQSSPLDDAATSGAGSGSDASPLPRGGTD